MVPWSIPPFLFTWLSGLWSSHCMLTNKGVITGGAVSETSVSVSLPLGLAHRQTHNTLWNGYLCLDTSVFDSTRVMFWILFQLFCWQNVIAVKCKEYNSTQWVCCRVDQLCLSVLKGVDYQTTTAKVIQFTFWNHFVCLSSSRCSLWCCS